MDTDRFSTALEAEQAYYRAFEQSDAAAMAAVWGTGEDIECIHPVGPRLRGRDVHAAWRDMFLKPETFTIHVEVSLRLEQGDLAVHSVVEHFHFKENSRRPLHILATNVYRRGADGWRLVLHHASPPPTMGAGKSAKTLH